MCLNSFTILILSILSFKFEKSATILFPISFFQISTKFSVVTCKITVFYNSSNRLESIHRAL